MPGASNIARNSGLIDKLKAQKASGRWIAAICASPTVVFHNMQVTDVEKMTCYDWADFRHPLKDAKVFEDARVVVSGKCITSVGPGSAIEFSLALVEQLMSKTKADEVANSLMLP